jgi:hypothetical protein
MDAVTTPDTDYAAEYYLTKNGSHLVLQTGTFGCGSGSKRAIVVNGAGGAWVGCWSDDGDKITIIWEDADTLVIPKNAIGTPAPPGSAMSPAAPAAPDSPTVPRVPKSGEMPT